MDTKTYSVPGMHCGHCQAAVTRELEGVSGVEAVDVNLDTKLVNSLQFFGDRSSDINIDAVVLIAHQGFAGDL